HWHQQTWHTIEFSNNRHITSTHQETRNPGQLFAFPVCGFSSLDSRILPVKSAFLRDFRVRPKVFLLLLPALLPAALRLSVAPEQLFYLRPSSFAVSNSLRRAVLRTEVPLNCQILDRRWTP